MSGKAKSKGQKTQHEQEAAKHTPITAKENEFRLVRLDDLAREFSLRLLAGAELDAATAVSIEEYGSSLGWPGVIFVRNVKDPELPRYASPEAEEQPIRQMVAEARICLDNLRTLAADGDRNSLSELVQLLARNVAWLEGYSNREKGNLKELAALLGVWPVMFNSRPRKQQQVADYLARIGLPTPKTVSSATSTNC